MKDKLNSVIEKYNQLSEQLTDQEVISNPHKLAVIAKEHRSLEELAKKAELYLKSEIELAEANEMVQGDDEEMREMAQEEISNLNSFLSNLEEELKVLLIPKDPNDDNSTILEIRCGTGGDEAALFAGDLMRMYLRYAEINNWKSKIINVQDNEGGGFKEVVVSIDGKGAYGDLKFESGVHRVQRVPETESSGRLHTSAATVAVLPQIEDIEIQIKDSDLKIDTYRASGAGGQHVNKTESAIRITHIPTGIIVTCQDQSSQHKNKDQAMKVIRSKIFEAQEEKKNKEIADARKSMVSTGDRSAKIRTYNFPQGRVTDHRINLTLYKLAEILDGTLNEFIEALKIENQKLLLDANES